MFGTLAGVLADRMDRKRTMIISDFGRGVLVLSLLLITPLAESSGPGTALWALAIINFALEMLTLIRQPAREAAVPTLVEPEQLVAANSLSLAAAYGTGPVGSIAFAALAELFESQGAIGFFRSAEDFAFGLDSITFTISGLIILSMSIPQPELAADSGDEKEKIGWRQSLSDIKEGLDFVAHERTVRNVVLGMAAALFGGGALIALGQPFSEQVLMGGKSGFGILVTALGLGVGGGMLAVAVFSQELARRDLTFAVSLSLTGATITASAMAATVWGAGSWVFLAGVSTGIAYVMGFTHLHETVDDTLRGRTFGALFTLVRTAVLVSFALAVGASELLDGRFGSPFDNGIRNVLLLGGVVILLSGLGTLWTMRDILSRPKLTKELTRSISDASDTFNAIRGRTKRHPRKHD